MSWHQQAMKDAQGCDKPRIAAVKLTRGSPNGITHCSKLQYLICSAYEKRHLGK